MAVFRGGRRFTDEEMDRARSASTTDVISSCTGWSFKRAGREYKCKEHNSLVVFSDDKGWWWYSQSLKGATAIDYLMKVENYNFQDAVTTIIGDRTDYLANQYKPASPTTIQNEETPKVIQLPERKTDGKFSNVYAYLTKTRCINPAVVSHCMKKGYIYQDVKNNCVFVGKDNQGEIKYVSMRGTCTLPNVTPFKGECRGSDKSYSFRIDGQPNSDKIYVFEAPIDALSHASLAIIKAELKHVDTNSWMEHTRLSLGGVSDRALDRYLSDNPQIKHIVLCLDNDMAGLDAAEKHIKKYTEKGYNVSSYPIPEGAGKDYNEYLVNYTQKKMQQSQTVIQSALNKSR